MSIESAHTRDLTFEKIFDLSKFAMPAIVVLGLASGGCGPEPDTALSTVPAPAVDPRFTVERVAVFPDNLAYDGRRGVYILHDKETGKDFIGVSGIGISELGSHSSGKTTVPDER